MKYIGKQVALASAVMLSAVASEQANATVAAVNASGAQSEMTLFAMDLASNTGYVRDLGLNWGLSSDLNTVLGSGASYTGDANYQTFLSQIGGLSGSVVWGVYSGTSFSSQTEVLTTANKSSSNWTQTSLKNAGYTNSNAPTIEQTWQAVAFAANGLQHNATSTFGTDDSINGSIVTTPGDGYANPLTEGWSQGFNRSLTTWNYAAGSSASLSSVYYLLTKGTSSIAGMTPTLLAGTWNFNATTGDLNYSVVPTPIPTPLILMLSGMVMVVVSSARRNEAI